MVVAPPMRSHRVDEGGHARGPGMSRSSQTKFLDILESSLPDGLELVVDYRFSNTGIARVEAKHSMEPKLRFDFNFQQDYFTLEDVRPKVPGMGIDHHGKQTITVGFQRRPTPDEVLNGLLGVL